MQTSIRKCTRCKEIKCLNKFNFIKSRNKYHYYCKKCLSEWKKEYKFKNSEKIKNKNKEYKEKNANIIKVKNKQYRIKNKNRDKKYRKTYYLKNKEEIKLKCNERRQKRFKEDPLFKIKERLRTRIYKALNGISKSVRTMELLGCSVEEYKKHLELNFKDGMTWENYGYNGWHIDHIRPCSSFDLSDFGQQKECFNYKNTQPLWAEENMKKGARYDK